MKTLLISSLILLTSCTVLPQDHDQANRLFTPSVQQNLLEHPCQAREVGKSLSDIAKNSKHNAYCVILYRNQLEEIKQSQIKGDVHD